MTLVCSYISYATAERRVRPDDGRELNFDLEAAALELEGVTVVARNPGRTEAGARGIERQAMNVVNVMSAKAIELSPDITVANVIQRMSGVTIERNSSVRRDHRAQQQWRGAIRHPAGHGQTL